MTRRPTHVQTSNKRAGLAGVHPHTLQHSCGYYLANKGRDLRTKISTYTCQIASTKGRQAAMAARTRSRVTSMARRGNRLAPSPATGATPISDYLDRERRAQDGAGPGARELVGGQPKGDGRKPGGRAGR